MQPTPTRFPRRTVHAASQVLTFATLGLLLSCGVKGPPLPPIPTTPQKSDTQDADEDAPRMDVVEQALRGAPEQPVPSPSPSNSPKKRGSGRPGER